MAKFKITNSDQGHNYIHYVEAIDRQVAIDTFKAGHYGTVVDCEEVATTRNCFSPRTLLPCPFCLSEPMWVNELIADGHYYIKCPNCHIVMKEDRRDKVIGMWNNRPNT